MQINELKGLFHENTDNYLVCSILCDGQWHNTIEFQMAKDKPGFTCRNFAARTRVSNIKAKIELYGFTVESEIDYNRQARYRIVKFEAQLSMAI